MPCSTEAGSPAEVARGSEGHSARTYPKRRGWRRVGLFFVALICAASRMRQGLAEEAESAALRSGRVIWGLASAHRANQMHGLLLNGLPLRLRTATVEVPWERVLTEAHRACAGQLAVSSWSLQRRLPVDGVVDLRGEADGVVACFETDRPWRDLLRSLAQVAETPKLGSLGRFRFLYVRRESDQRSAVLSLWSEGPLNVLAAFPPDGDAPGADDPALPRPSSSRRVLSAVHTGLGRSLVVYHVEVPLERVAEEYARSLRLAGAVVEPFGIGGSSGEIDEEPSARMWLVRTSATSWVSLLEDGAHTWVVGLPALDR